MLSQLSPLRSLLSSSIRKWFPLVRLRALTCAPRYAEFPDSVTGVVDDVEFLFSLDAPIVGYRSQPRAGSDNKRGRNRIRDIRKALAPAGWKSVGRIVD